MTNPFDVAAVLITIAALAGYVNYRVLRLPSASGTLVVALVSSFVIIAAEAILPGVRLRPAVSAFLGQIDFEQTLMRGMLCFLLFAGALHVNAGALMRSKWTVGALATVGVGLSTGIVGVLTWWAFGAIGAPVPLVICFVFGALISPTDPIAVMGLLKELRAPESLEAQIAGESLFNDGIGVVVFFAFMSLAGLPSGAEVTPGHLNAAGFALFFAREVGGGIALGLALGYVGYFALLSIDEHPLELLITLALAMFLYAISFRIGVSGPIAIVTAGLLIGNRGRSIAMSERTRVHVDAFWGMVDEILNAVLFVLIGLEVLAVQASPLTMAAGLVAVPIVLAGRFLSVSSPIGLLNVRGRWSRGLIPVLTWSGLRGGISVAMVLSMPHFPTRDLLLACTYAVVVFSILVQGLTMRRVLERYAQPQS